VEESFGPYVTQIMDEGSYDQALGFDYDWTNAINESGQQLAAFLNCLSVHEFNNLDIEAHSEGVAVALSAATQTSVALNNMVLLGGPILGTPATNSTRSLKAILAAFPQEGATCPGGYALQHILDGRFYQDLSVNSTVLPTIVDNFNRRTQHPNVFQVAGNTPFLASPLEEKFLYCADVDMTNIPYDGIIPVASATHLLNNGRILGPYPVNHVHLQGNQQIILDVASYVSPDPPNPNPCSSPLTGTWVGTWQWSGPGSNGCFFNDGGTFSMTLTQTGGSFSGDTSGEGIETRDAANGCVLVSVDPGEGTISGTISGTSLSLLFNLDVLNFDGTAILNDDTITAEFVRDTGGTGSFSVTRQ